MEAKRAQGAGSRDPLARLPEALAAEVLSKLSLRHRTRLELVNRTWRERAMQASKAETKPVWVYVIFRKNHCSGHEKMTVNLSFDGPIFWNRQVAYIYCCSCHFDEHEGPLMTILAKLEQRVERVCLVDRPVDYPFLPDSLFKYMALNMPRLQFIYLRELDLEKINRGTVVLLANHKLLKKVIVHGCRNYEVLQDFHNLPQLLVVRGEILGLKAMLGDLDFDDSVSGPVTKRSESEGNSSIESSEESPSLSTSVEITTVDQA